MKRFILLAIFAIFAAESGLTQSVDRSAPVLGFDDHNQADHDHSYCKTINLLDTEEAKEHHRQWQQWVQSSEYELQILETYEVGDQRTFKVRSDVTVINNPSYEDVAFTLRAKGDLTYVWVEDDEFGDDKVTQSDADEMLANLEERTPAASHAPDDGIVSISQDVFGDAPNVDGSGMLHVLVLDVRDDWDPEEGGGYVAGYFDTVDQSPSNANSNRMDIIYVDSYPHIYTDDNPSDVSRALSTIAHEYQHLIHFRYNNLHLFQNEGQSEWAEMLTGYRGRGIDYVMDPGEINRYIYTWRRDSPNVLRDYQRAGLLHTYLADRGGVSATGAVTRAGSSGNSAYSAPANQANVSVSRLLADFHVANLVNNNSIEGGRFGYSDSRRANVRAMGVSVSYQPGRTSASANRSLRFGGAEYVEFVGARDFSLSFDSDPGVYSYIVASTTTGDTEVHEINGSSFNLSGDYERIVLVSAFTQFAGGVNEDTQASYSYDANWETLPVIQEILSYFGSIEFFTTLPGDQSNDDFAGRKKFAHRISPGFDGRIQSVSFVINNRDTGIQGNTDLLLILTEAEGTTAGYGPGEPIDTLSVPFSNLSLGDNIIETPGTWQVEEDQEYFIQLDLANRSAGMLEFLLDSGSDNEENTNYFPARTLIYIEQPTVNEPGWYRFGGDGPRNNNLVMSVSTTGLFEGETEEPTVIITEGRRDFVTGEDLILQAEFTGQPRPTFQWYKDDEAIAGARSQTLIRENASTDDSGFYTVEVTNFAGSQLSESVEVSVISARLALNQNYPNPFNPVTNIEYVVPYSEPEHVQLKVYTVDGRLVKTLVDEPQAAGLYTVTFDALNLASGVYVYQLIVGNRTRSEKMTLIR